MLYYLFCHAGVAQPVEQLICNQRVGGSSPLASSSYDTEYNNEVYEFWRGGRAVNGTGL